MAPNVEHSFIVCNNDVEQVLPLISNFEKRSHGDGTSDYDTLVNKLGLRREGIVSLLLEKGSRVIQGGSSTAPLQMAIARMGWSSVVEKLVSLGAMVSEKNCHGDTALHLAFEYGSSDGVVDMLLTKYLSETTVNVENKDGLNFLHIACTRLTIAHVQALIDRGVDNIDYQVHPRSCSRYAGYSSLHFAVHFGRYEIAAMLLRSGANIYVQDRNGSTPVHLALYTGDQQMIDLLFAYDNRRENCINNFGLTHFMAACAGSRTRIAEGFLFRVPMAGHRVIARVRDLVDHPYAGYSPIHFATDFGNFETVQLLLNYGASSYSMTADNWSPMALASCNDRKDILQLLQQYSMRENEIFFVGKLCGDGKWPNF